MIPVLYSADDLQELIREREDYLIAPYLLYKKNPHDLLLSTSSMHMNWLWEDVLYVPMNIEDGDHAELEKIYRMACKYDNIIFFNHTIPHKSNPVMQEMFGKDEYGDYLCRVGNTYRIADGNGKAFVQMVRELANNDIDFAQVTVVVVGVGGAGYLAAKAIKAEQPKQMILVDIEDKSSIAQEFGAEFYLGIENVPDLSGASRLVIIDATAHFKQGIQQTVAYDLVKKYDAADNIFIDYNMYTQIGAYNNIKTSTGVGKEYVAITNYVMVLEIIKAAESAGVALPHITREVFNQAVKNSVHIRDKINDIINKGQK
jgi:shikimate 5-dehydrogenase